MASATTMVPVLSDRPSRIQAERQRDDGERCQQQRTIFGGEAACHSNFSIRSPSSPRGRTSSTKNIST
jgi:hypothetical protein